ncbi:MAG: hypothetical protein ACHQK8_01360 [Bacteroidia bacterium]
MKNTLQKITAISIIFLLLLAQMNCSKENASPSGNNPANTFCKLISDQTSGGASDQFTYQKDGKLSSMKGSDSIIYNYVNSTTVYMFHNLSWDTLSLSNGLVNKSVNGTNVMNFYYDANGFLIKQSAPISPPGQSQVADYTWSNGNLTAQHSYTTGPSGTQDNGTLTMTYNNIVNKTNIAIVGVGYGGDSYISTGLFGKNSTNFPVSIKFLASGSNQNLRVNYTFDNNNLPTKFSVIDSTGANLNSVTLNFSCN